MLHCLVSADTVTYALECNNKPVYLVLFVIEV